MSAEVATDALVEGDYSRLALGIRSPYSVTESGGAVRPAFDTPVRNVESRLEDTLLMTYPYL